MKKTSATEHLTLVLILALAAVLLFWNLTARYLWQDEAATGVLAVRMLQSGRPLAYDGKNLLTIDILRPQEALERLGSDTAGSLAYFAGLGDFKPNYSWKWHPWGLFLVAAAGIKLLGQNTLGARLPFTLAAFATVPLLFRLVRRQFDSLPMAVAATLLLVTNAYWILHARQARYYALDSLALVIALWAYARWQWGGGGPALFLATVWCWFQVDFGTVLPVTAVFFAEALIAAPRAWGRTVKAGLILAVTLAPFVYYYEILQRKSYPFSPLFARFTRNLFNMNEYLAALLVVAGAMVFLHRRWPSLAVAERRLVTLCAALFCAFIVWVPVIAPDSFLRYSIVILPAGAILTAWFFVRLLRSAWLLGAGVAIVIFTPWIGLPAGIIAAPPAWSKANSFYRAELADMYTDIFGNEPDPNRIVIDYLRAHSVPTDEILINYEDIPLMYYLPNPIRGGIGAFQVTDDNVSGPRFAVLRRSVEFVDWPLFNTEMQRHQWEKIPLKAPDIPWGNFSDPEGHKLPDSPTDLYIARRVGP